RHRERGTRGDEEEAAPNPVHSGAGARGALSIGPTAWHSIWRCEPPDLAEGGGAPPGRRRARVVVLQGGRRPDEQGPRRRRLPQTPEAGGAPALPRLRPPAYVREPVARRERADHLRLGAVGALEPHHHAVLRPLEPEPGEAR